jgi:hypothetical protein
MALKHGCEVPSATLLLRETSSLLLLLVRAKHCLESPLACTFLFCQTSCFEVFSLLALELIAANKGSVLFSIDSNSFIGSLDIYVVNEIVNNLLNHFQVIFILLIVRKIFGELIKVPKDSSTNRFFPF